MAHGRNGGSCWTVIPPHPEAEALSRAAGVTVPTAQVAYNRGLTTPEDVRAWMRVGLAGFPPPSVGARAVAMGLWNAFRERRRIIVAGDYDADGLCGTAILYWILSGTDADVWLHMPERAQGYGLSTDVVRNVAAEGGHTIVTVDCGIGECEAAQFARDHNTPFYVIDHHPPTGPLPPASGICHPMLETPQGPPLCGAGLAWWVAWALMEIGFQSNNHPITRSWRRVLAEDLAALAAIATVADVVPMVSANRALVRWGLARLPTCQQQGLRALLEVSGLTGDRITAEDVAFQLAPRLNAAGRLGDAGLALRLLTTGDPERCREIAGRLCALNTERKEQTAALLGDLVAALDGDMAGRPALVKTTPAPGGLLGPMAAQLAGRYHVPVVLVTAEPGPDGLHRGSGRSVPGVDLRACLEGCADTLSSWGGHPAAVGLAIEPEWLPRFAGRLVAAVGELGPVEPPRRLAEGILAPTAATPALAADLAKLGPWGADNPRPVWAADARLYHLRTFGQGDRHLSARLGRGAAGRSIVGYGLGPRVADAHHATRAFFEVTPRGPLLVDFTHGD